MFEALGETTEKLGAMADTIGQEVPNIRTTFQGSAVNLNSFLANMSSSIGRMENDIKNTTESVMSLTETFSQRIPETLDNINSSFKVLEQTSHNINEKVNTIGDSLEELIKSYKPENSPAGNFVRKIKDNWVLLSANILGLTQANSKSSIFLPIFNISSVMGFNQSIFNGFSGIFERKPEEQGYENTSKLMMFLLGTSKTMFPSTILSKLNLAQNVKEMEAMDKLMDMFSDVLAEWGIDVSSKTQLVVKLRERLIEVIQATPDYETNLVLKPTKFQEKSYYEQFQKHKKIIDELRIEISTNVYQGIRNSNFSSDLMILYNRYKSMSDQIEAINASIGERPVPAAFMFCGDPGLGKSTIIKKIIGRVKELAKEKYLDRDDCTFMLDIENWTTWFQNKSDQYHQGLYDHEFHVCDDVFSRQDNEDHADVISFIGPTPYISRQAAIPDKGRKYRALCYLGSCNVFPTQSKTLTCVSALQRRFTVVDCTQVGTIPKDFDKDFPHLKMQIFSGSRYQSDKALGLGKICDIDGLCHLIINKMIAHDQNFQASLSQFQISYSDCPPAPYEELGNEFLLAKEYLQIRHPKLLRQLCRCRIPFSEDESYPVIESLRFRPELNDLATLMKVLEDYDLLPDTKTAFRIMNGNGSLIWFGNKLHFCGSKGIPLKQEKTSMDYEEEFFLKMKAQFYQFWLHLETFRPMQKIFNVVGVFGVCATHPLMIPIFVSIGFLIGVLIGSTEDIMFKLMWEAAYDCTLSLIILGFVSYFLYQTFQAFMRINTEKFCEQCILHYQEEPVFRAIKSQCALTCTGEQHSATCNLWCMLSTQVTKCTACELKLCEGNCYHSTQADNNEELVNLKIKVAETVISEKYEKQIESLEKLNDKGEKPKTKKFESSSRSTTFKKVSTKLSDRFTLKEKPVTYVWPDEGTTEYSFGGHFPGSWFKKEPKVVINSGEEDPPEESSPVEEVCIDLAAKSIMTKIIDNTVMCNSQNNNTAGQLHGIGFKRYVITPAHFHHSSDGNRVYTYTLKGSVYSLLLIGKNVPRDIALWSIPKEAPSFSDCFYRNLMTEQELEKVLNTSKQALQYIPSGNFVQLVNVSYKKEPTKICLKGGNTDKSHVLRLTATEITSPVTENGDCGGVVVAMDNTIRHKVLGFHIIGAMNCSYSASITSTLIDTLLDSVIVEGHLQECVYIVDQPFSSYTIVDNLNLVTQEDEEKPFMPHGDFHYIGEIELQRVSSKTALEPHPFKGLFPERHRPAITQEHLLSEEMKKDLHKNAYGYSDLLVTQTSKYGKEFQDLYNPEYLDIMKEEYTDYLVELLGDVDLGISDERSILNGDFHDPDSHPLDVRTSPGIPWSSLSSIKNVKKKAYLVEVDVEKDPHYMFDRTLEHVERLLKNISDIEEYGFMGVRTLSILKNCLKDELRPCEKIHKPRAFMTYPLDKLYLVRKYFLKFKTEWTKLTLRAQHAVGINPLSVQWAQLFYRLKEVSSEGFDADFKSFDGNLRADFIRLANAIMIGVISKIMENRNEKITPEVLDLMKILLDEIVCTISVSRSTVYMDNHGNPSGSPLTTVTNCIVNFLYHWYAFMRITGKTSLAAFLSEVAIVVFGDDVIQTVKYGSKYTFETVQKIMQELGQDYTTALKNDSGGMMKLQDMRFLKRKFVQYSDAIILAPIEEDSLMMRFNWTHIKPTDFECHAILIKESLVEASLLGTSFYSYLKDRIKSGIHKQHWNRHSEFTKVVLSYSDSRAEFLERYGSI